MMGADVSLSKLFALILVFVFLFYITGILSWFFKYVGLTSDSVNTKYEVKSSDPFLRLNGIGKKIDFSNEKQTVKLDNVKDLSMNKIGAASENKLLLKDNKPTKGLLVDPSNGVFLLNGKEFRILSGSMHYFRIVPEYWRARLLELKASGLNTVTTYVAWNMHEKIMGKMNFTGMLDLRKYVKIAHDLGLYVILRPGPYICSEWDYGGLPSWLLHDPNMRVRTTYRPYLQAAHRYMKAVMKQVADLQFTRGGPIIAFQLENEYTNWGTDTKYMDEIHQMFVSNDVVEFLFVCHGGPEHLKKMKPIPGVMQTANWNNLTKGKEALDILNKIQPKYPFFNTEFWAGWFDTWGNRHHITNAEDYGRTLKWILDQKGGSVNLYMFHGGTNFGFMNGASIVDQKTKGAKDQLYLPQTTSYDYDSPLSEHGRHGNKYDVTKKVLSEYVSVPEINLDSIPAEVRGYGSVHMGEYLSFMDALKLIKYSEKSEKLIPMEMLKINGGGQGYGFVMYEAKHLKPGTVLNFMENVKDYAYIFVNERYFTRVNYTLKHPVVNLEKANWKKGSENSIGILVENCGRVNYFSDGDPSIHRQRKGLSQPLFLDENEIFNWTIKPFEMEDDFLKLLSKEKWSSKFSGYPSFIRGTLISRMRYDTFVDMTGWGKGIVFINGFNLGRYWEIGPQRSLFLPAPLLRTDRPNEIILFEGYKISNALMLGDRPRLNY